jgi:integrase
MPVPQLKKGHVTEWIDSHSTWRSSETRRGVISVVLAAFNRAQNLFDVRNPLKGLKKPRPQPRLTSISSEDEQALYDACEPRFREFLFAAIHTGLRPFCELALLTAQHVEEHERGMMWRVYSTKTKKTRKIPVRPEVAKLVRKLIKSSPPGQGVPIFRNTQENPWKRTNGVVRFIDLRKKLKWQDDPIRSKYTCYSCRHTFAHRMLSGYWTGGAGCSIETLAELLGDTPKVAFEHYGKEWGQHYQAPLWAAIGEAAPSADKSVSQSGRGTSGKSERTKSGRSKQGDRQASGKVRRPK